ncbi:keratin-associated protein 16-1-like [Myzus persicae]|uniref:keratin-associated protein 16-1-like n=1 Tax=Myzus persicae TaxID=13164 RepID=UPI000B931496|nr:keratin-associated protein 16-1-like [Myzus persicae]
MSKKGVDVCISAQCCCKLIMACPEKPAPVAVVKPPNSSCERAKTHEMSLCDFLKSQSAPDFIKNLQENRAEAKSPRVLPRGPVRPAAAKARICSEQPPTTDRGVKQPLQNCQQDIKQDSIQPASAVHEDRNISQIIINIGTIITHGVCKHNACQQTEPEVKTSVCPPAKLPTSVCPPVKRPTSICPPAEKPTTCCPPVERPKSICPPAEKPTSVCPPAEKPTSVCPPAERPIAVIGPKARPSVDRPVPVSRDRSCRSNAPVSIPITEQKPCPEPTINFKMNCCCTCHV